MKRKRFKFLWLITAALLAFAMLIMVACNDKANTQEEEAEGTQPTPTQPTYTFSQYMNKINTGLKASQTRVTELEDYYVESEFNVYTRVENLTINYCAVYEDNRRDGKYFVRVFDNGAHQERLNVYYDGRDLFITVRDLHYVVREFSKYILFDTFSLIMDYLDIDDLVFGQFMQTYFSETTMLSAAIGTKDFTYAKAGMSGESIGISSDLSIIIGVLNAQLEGIANTYGTSIDAITDHYLGFEASKFFALTLGSFVLNDLRFNLNGGAMTELKVDITGRMQDTTPYFIRGGYKYNDTSRVIENAKDIPNKYAYKDVDPGEASFDGTATIFRARETEFQFSLDYDVNVQENDLNRVAMRVYDQLATNDELSPETKYDKINELLSAYYDDEIMYLNTAGAYTYVGSVVALNALRLPKIYFPGFNLSNTISIIYTDALQVINILLDSLTGGKNPNRARTVAAVVNAMRSDVPKKEVSFTLTEQFVNEVRGDNTTFTELFAKILNVDEELLEMYGGKDFLAGLSIVFRYNFETKVLNIEFYNESKEIIELSMWKVNYIGVKLPLDLDELNYAEFKKPEVVTLTYVMEFNPYGTKLVDVSGFFGAFIGDSTGKNTPYYIKAGQTILVEGRMSEFYQTNYRGERETVTTLDLAFYLTSESGSKKELWMTVTTNPASRTVSELLIRNCLPLGDYDGNDGDVYYIIDRNVVSEELNKLVGGTGIFSESVGIATVMAIYNASDGNGKTYSQDGYFSVDLMVDGENDPINKLIGVKNTNGRLKFKVGFDNLDLSGLDADEFTTPYIHQVEDVTKRSIYSEGSAWKKTISVGVSGKTINFLATYEEESIEIITGKTDYTPTAYIFGKEFSYGFHIVTAMGTYKVRTIDIDRNLIVIDPAYEKVPTEVPVTFEGAEKGYLDCVIEGFKETWVTNDGYNLPLLDGVFADMPTYTLVIGKDSIATIEQEVYVTVINRKIIPITDEFDQKMYYVKNGKQIPVVGDFVADPYTVAMRKKVAADGGETYDYLASEIYSTRITIQFENRYGTQTIFDEETGEQRVEPLVYDREGYNWFYLSDLDLDWDFPTNEFNYLGETRYAVATFGSANGYPIQIAIKVDIMQKRAISVTIDGYAEGTYTIDYLKKETYDIPTETTSTHTVYINFEDGTKRMLIRGRPNATISDEEYCTGYFFGQLLWAGAADVGAKLELQGTTGLFGSGINATNTTTATLGTDLVALTQTVSLNILAPSRYISGSDMTSMTLVPNIATDGTLSSATSMQVTKTARFTESNEEPGAGASSIESFAINPYNKTAVLPNTIWLYVNMTMSDSGKKAWVEYPVEWVTTNKSTVTNGEEVAGEELNIIKLNKDGNYVLAHPVNNETRLVVYGRVGFADAEYNRRIWVTMSILNMESNIKEYKLFLENGETFGADETVSIDPYLSYFEKLPKSYAAVLGSGEQIEGETNWYYDVYPIIRQGEFENERYNGRYDEYGYYIFPRAGGTFTLKMNISADSVNNFIYIEATVNARDIYSEYTDETAQTKVSDYIDIFATGKSTGDTYRGEASPGYADVGYYEEFSSRLLAKIEELIAADGIGISGLSFIQTKDTEMLYARKIRWDLEKLIEIRDALMKKSNAVSFEGANALMGEVDEDNINHITIMVKITIKERTKEIIEVAFPNIKNMTIDGIYTIANDRNGNGAISMGLTGEYSSLKTNTAFYRNTQYNTYFGTTGYYESSFDGIFYFKLNEAFHLSTTSAGLYVSPYDYFTYLFGNLKLNFQSTILQDVKATVSTGTRTAHEFNNSVLGFNPDTIIEDVTGQRVSYSFLILEKISEGSAIDRTLVIIEATVASVVSFSRTDNIDALKEDLTEKFTESSPFVLPSVIEVTFKVDSTGALYTVKYAVDGWEPLTISFNNAKKMTFIENKYINIIDGTQYVFRFTLPDMEDRENAQKDYYYTVRFLKRDINSVNFDALAENPIYNIQSGIINVENSYVFLEKTKSGYEITRSEVPKMLTMQTGNGLYDSGGLNTYSITKWLFDTTVFDESIFSRGTVGVNGENNGVVIATYEFNSYYRNNVPVTQRLVLKVIMVPMVFYSMEAKSDGVQLEIVSNTTVEESTTNEVFNTIVIDPYSKKSGNLRLPTTVNIKFNGNQLYTATNVTYKLVNERNNSEGGSITNLTFDERGHTLQYAYLLNPLVLKLYMYVQGYSESGKGLRVNVRFLQRTITDMKLPNYVYKEGDGTYDYETRSGQIVYENGNPKKKEYYSYANYSYTPKHADEATEMGQMAVYFIDPYNNATHLLPTSARFEFAETQDDVYLEYDITGWQYYDYEKEVFMNLPNSPTSTVRFSQSYDSSKNIYRGYFNANEYSYQGATYIMRGYIQVGQRSQYFDVVCIVLNRTLKTRAVLDMEYKVKYDFSDPVAAVLSDIPALLGESAFVNYDKYCERFNATATRSDGVGTFEFTMTTGFFSQKTGDTQENFAVIPYIAWEDEFDLDGDGIKETRFEDLTNIGYDGDLTGAMFYHNLSIKNLIELYTEKARNDYAQTIATVMWDSLFTEKDTVSIAYSEVARTAIASENQNLKNEVLYYAKLNMLEKNGIDEEIDARLALSPANKQTVQVFLYNNAVETVMDDYLSKNRVFNEVLLETQIDITKAIYNSVLYAYTTWKTTNQKEINAYVEIYLTWEYFISMYTGNEVSTGRNITDYQKLKAKHYTTLYNSVGIFSTDEKERLTNTMNVLLSGQYKYINSDIWNDVYVSSSPKVCEMMDAYAVKYATSDGVTGTSIAFDAFKKDYIEMQDLGVIGETTFAEITMPVIDFAYLSANGTQTTTITFNKFNFDSIESEFSVTFEIDYEAIYDRMNEEAKEEAIRSFVDEKKEEILTEYRLEAVKERINNVAPKVVDGQGNQTVIPAMRTNPNDPNTGFNYEMWTSTTDRKMSYYGSFWEGLVTYRYNYAVNIISANIEGLSDYAGLAYLEQVTETEWATVKYAFVNIKAPQLANIYLDYLERKYNVVTKDGRTAALKDLVDHIIEKDENIFRKADAYAVLGLNVDVNDENYSASAADWLTAKTNYINEMKVIAANENDYIESVYNVMQSNAVRAAAVKMLADYIIGEDAYIQELEEIYGEQGEEKNIELTNILMEFNIDIGKTDIINALKVVGRENGAVDQNGVGNYEIGNAIVFAYAVNDIIDLLFELAVAPMSGRFTFTFSADTVSKWGSLRDKYTISQYAYPEDGEVYKGIMLYIAINGGETANMGTTRLSADIRDYTLFCRDFLWYYVPGRTSPYDLLLKDQSMTNFTKEQLESYNSDGTLSEDCLLYKTVYDPEKYAILSAFKAQLGMTEEEIALALKKYTLFESIVTGATYMSATTRSELDRLKREAREDVLDAAETRIFSRISEQAKNSLRSYVETGSDNVTTKAFIDYVEKEEEGGRKQGQDYIKYRDEYVEAHYYDHALSVITELQLNYETSLQKPGADNLTEDSYLARNVFFSYFNGKGYETITDYTDDYHNEAQLVEAVKLKLKEKNMTLTEDKTEVVAERYMQDGLLRAFAYFYDNIANEVQKNIIEEVSELYIGESMSNDLEKSYINAAANAKLNGIIGITIYEDIIVRDDMGANIEEEINNCYYYVWLTDMIAGVEYDIENYPLSEMKGKNPYITSEYISATMATLQTLLRSNNVMEYDALAEYITAEKVRRKMAGVVFDAIRYNYVYNQKVLEVVNLEAMKYAYDCIYYDETSAYVEIFDRILEELVGQDDKLDELTFREMESKVLKGYTEPFDNAVSLAVQTVLYDEVFDKIKLFGLSAKEFASKAYAFMTNGAITDDPETMLFGADRNGTGGLFGRIIQEYKIFNGDIPISGEADISTRKLTNWWETDLVGDSSTMYGRLSQEEQDFIFQIYTQAYYQLGTYLSGTSFNVTLKKKVAYVTMIASIYLFLSDMEEYINENMPKDYFDEECVEEYKAYFIKVLLNSNVMSREGHLLTLAQAKLKTIIGDLAKERAALFHKAYTTSGMQTYATTEENLQHMVQCIISIAQLNNGATPEETDLIKRLFVKYVAKAVEYVEYTSVAGNSYYRKSVDYIVENPLRTYIDTVYRSVTGYGISGSSGSSQDVGMFDYGMRSFGSVLYDCGNDYTAALIGLYEVRQVTTKYYSEDHAEEGERHVVYFDRNEWDTAYANGERPNATYNNKNLFFTNPKKTEKITDISGGYGYSGASKATGYRYQFTDFTTVELYYYGEDKPANTLAIDALQPAFPSKATAIGYIGTGEMAKAVKLGEVEITEYSQEFRKLVFNGSQDYEGKPNTLSLNIADGETVICMADDAYSVTIKAANGDTFSVTKLYVGYLDRSIENLYLSPEEGEKTYARNKVANIVQDQYSDYVGLYSLYNADEKVNIMYVSPIDEKVVLAHQKTYAMPSRIYVKTGQGGKMTFSEVVWDMSNVPYSLEGTTDSGVEMKILSYKYVDAEGKTRLIEYDYDNGKAQMYTINSEGELSLPQEYLIDSTISWNVKVVVENRVLNSISVPGADDYVQIGAMDKMLGYVDASNSDGVNPYYPEFPTRMFLSMGTEVREVNLKQSDWAPNASVLRNIKEKRIDTKVFTASFAYLGHTITVLFRAMDITLNTYQDITGNAAYPPYEGGTVYLVRGEGDARTQFEKNYGVMYFNFGDEVDTNWQKVPVALQNYSRIDMGTSRKQEVEAIIGGLDDPNAVFTVQVVDFKTYALLDGGTNKYVLYDYYSVPIDNGRRVDVEAGDKDGMTGTYILYSQNGTKIPFTVEEELTTYDYAANEARITVSYALGDETSDLLAFNADGERKRTYQFGVEMKTYERGDITFPMFDTNSDGKIWTWTDISKTDPRYTDGIYWPIGQEMKASDLPTVIDTGSGIRMSLMWDLTDLNVNKANVKTPGVITQNDGVTIVGWYLTKYNTWAPMNLKVYINKINITSRVIESTTGSDYINKDYDSLVYKLPFDSEKEGMKMLREDGTYDYITNDKFAVEYCVANDNENEREWSKQDFPRNAGEYYIRIRFVEEEDYNVYIQQTDGWLFKLTIRPYVVNLARITFEDEESGSVSKTYTAGGEYLTVTGGLPSFKPDNWLERGEKNRLLNVYLANSSSEEEAKSKIYNMLYGRVGANVKNMIDEWYNEAYAIVSTSTGFGSLSLEERTQKTMAWVFDNLMDEDLTIYEVQVVIRYSYNGQVLEKAPKDCGQYAAVVGIEENPNYTTTGSKTLMLEIHKDYDLVYSVENDELPYTGEAQNILIHGLHVKGVLPLGVTVKYTYTFAEGVLTIISTGTVDKDGNDINEIKIDTANTTVPNPVSGVKNVGTYLCSIVISGGVNFIDGVLDNFYFTVTAASIFIKIEDITAAYLSEVADLNQYIKVFDINGNTLDSGNLMGTDKLDRLGLIIANTEVKSYYRTGTYYTYLEGLKVADYAEYTYTEVGNGIGETRYFNDETYSRLSLKGYELNGSLYKDREAYEDLITFFGNYNIFIKRHYYNAQQVEGAAGLYRIILEEDLENEGYVNDIKTNEEYLDVINSLRDGDKKILYLSPIYDQEGRVAAYDNVTINVNASLTIVGYKTNETKEIETYIKGIKVLRGTLTLKIVRVEADKSGSIGVYIGDRVNYAEIADCVVTKKGEVENTVGIETSVNYRERLYIHDSTFENLSMAIRFVGGELEIETSVFSRNYNCVDITINSNSISIRTTTFTNNTMTAIRSVTKTLAVRQCVFEYNGMALDLPEDSTIRINLNNGNTYINNGDDE